jgi:hypothetical protein
VINVTEWPEQSWWALIRGKLTACWRQLCLVQLLFAGLGLAVWAARTWLDVLGQLLAGSVWSAVAGGLLSAWNWSAVLRILDGGHGVRAALAPDLRRTGRLWAWLTVLGGLDQLGLLALVGPGAYTSLVFSHLLDALKLLALFLAFASALLPMTVLLEGDGLPRAWRLARSGWPTALRIIGTLVFGAVLLQLVELPQAAALSGYPYWIYFPLLQAAGVVFTQLGRVLTAPMLYTAYRLALLGPDPAAAPAAEVLADTVPGS